MSIENVRKYLSQFALQDRIIEFDSSSATVELAAIQLGCEPKRIAKTLSFSTPTGAMLIVLAGDAKIDNHKFKDTFAHKAKMLSKEETGILIGHEVGGVCPFAVKNGVPIYLDVSLKRFSSIYPAAGSANSAIEMTLEELERYSNAEGWVDVSKIS